MNENKQNKEPLNKDFKEPKLTSYQLTNAYESKRMDEICKVISGGTPDTSNNLFWNGNINWFTPTEIGLTKYVTNSLKKITAIGLNNSSAKIIPPYSILVTTRASLGLESINLLPCTTNQGFQSLVPKQNINLDYLYYLIQTNKFQYKLCKYSTKSTFLEISNKEIRKLKITIHSDPIDQKYIGSLLSLVDSKIELFESKISALKKYKEGLQRILLLSDKSKNEKRLKELVIFSSKSNLSAGASDSNAPYPFYLSGDKIGKIHCYQLDGCYVIANDGGEAGFRLTNGKFSYSDHCICFKANENYITKNLYEYLDSIKKRVTYAGFVGSGLKNIDRDYLRNLKIPDSINSKAISRLFELINGMIDNLNGKMLALKSCKNFLLRNMFI